MANYKATYKIFNGVSWDEYYFKTTADMVEGLEDIINNKEFDITFVGDEQPEESRYGVWIKTNIENTPMMAFSEVVEEDSVDLSALTEVELEKINETVDLGVLTEIELVEEDSVDLGTLSEIELVEVDEEDSVDLSALTEVELEEINKPVDLTGLKEII